MRTIVSLALTTLAVLSSVTSTAVAEGHPWPFPSCDVGELRAAEATVESFPGFDVYRVHVPGSLACGYSSPEPKYGIGVFTPYSATIYDSSLREYAPTAPTTFVMTQQDREGTGYCLMSGMTKRLSCVMISRVNGSVAVVQASPGDPYFVRRVYQKGEHMGKTPECPSCW